MALLVRLLGARKTIALGVLFRIIETVPMLDQSRRWDRILDDGEQQPSRASLTLFPAGKLAFIAG